MTPMRAGEWRQTMGVLAASIHELRTALGWSQEQLAARAVVSQGAISRLEAGHVLNVPLHTVVAVLGALMQGSQQLELPLAPAMQALQHFLATFDGRVAVPLDPKLLMMLRIYHSFPSDQQAALVAFLRLAGTLTQTREVA